jgi:hypothetical protein
MFFIKTCCRFIIFSVVHLRQGEERGGDDVVH